MKPFITTLAFVFAVCCNMQAQAWGDFTLYSLQNSNTAQLMNNAQQVVKTWTFPTADKTGYSSYLLPGGSVMRAVSRTGNSFTGGPICGKVQTTDWAGNTTWDFVYSTTQYCTHHDICPMPNGNVLLISYEVRTAAEATAKGATNGILMWPDKIVEVKPTGLTTGTVVWEWKIWDHTCQNTDAAKADYVSSIVDNPQLLNINYKTTKDWIHMNGVDYNPILDQITFSSHNLNEWYVIDHSTTTAEAAGHTGGRGGKGGDFLFRWGGPASYGATGTAILNVTHDAHWIPEGVPNTGRLVGFNNKGVSASQSAVDQAMPPRVGYNYTRTAGAAYAPATYDARHPVTGYSSNMGNSQQLPNGNMLVCVATAGKVYEINSAGTQIWTKTFTGSCPQAFKYDSCYVFNQPPAVPTITQTCTGLTLPAATTYQWYMNGDIIAGANAQTYTPTQNGAFVGRITDANGCVFRYAPTFDYVMTTAATTATATTCGLANGTATATALGNAPFTYAWSNGATTSNITNVAGATYTVTVSNSLGCTMSTTANVATSAAAAATATATATTCGQANGSISVAVQGTAPYTHLWSNGQTGASISNLSPGNYTVTSTNSDGCATSTSAAVLGSNATSVSATSTATEVGGFTGTATATASNGTAPYTYLWNNGMTNSIATFLSVGNYCVTIADANNCTATACVDVLEVVSTNAANSGISFVLSPNPTADIITIKTDLTNYTATLSDVTGKVLLSQKEAKTFDLSAFANGTYLVTLKNNDGATLTQRIVKR